MSPKRHRGTRNCLRLAVLSTAVLVASALGGGVASAEASCSTFGQLYSWSTGYYEISGGNCTDTKSKMVVSGQLTGPGRYYEIRKTCYDTKSCLHLSPTLKNPPGRQAFRLAVVFAYKTHWYSIPKYMGINKVFYA